MQLSLYSLSDEGKTVIFSINLCNFELPSGIKPDDVSSVFVTASFTAWRKTDAFEMKKNSGSDLWTLTKKAADTESPGNTGFPEFNFLIFTKEGKAFNIGAKTPVKSSFIPCQEVFSDNFIILSDKTKLPEIKNYGEKLLTIQTLKDYDLSKEEERSRISNVRRVPAARFLWRGYHPYKKSRPAFDTENTRIKLVNKALRKNRIKSIITLCGEEKVQKELKEKISRYVRKIQKKRNQLFIETSYETVYFESNGKEFASTIKTIAEFIISHPAPFYIHCRLGSDRTGTISGILAALCGASWDDISKDYEKTSMAGFGEFRSKRLLEYSYKRILGKSPSESRNLQKEFETYFLGKEILSQNQINKLRQKLTEGN